MLMLGVENSCDTGITDVISNIPLLEASEAMQQASAMILEGNSFLEELESYLPASLYTCIDIDMWRAGMKE